jgi:hypothetical protein
MNLEKINTPDRLSPEQLAEGMVYTKDIWDINKRKGVRFSYDPNEWTSYSNADGRLILGGKPVPVSMKPYFNLGENTSDADIKKYIFSHENMHHVVFDTDKSGKRGTMINLLDLAFKFRKTLNVGLSRLGSFSFYKGKTEHEEDIVEMLNLYAQNPQKLKDYLQYLVTTETSNLGKYNQIKLSQEVADHIYVQIEELILDFIERNREPKK